MNKLFFIGRLATDPQLNHTQSGTAVCNFRLAVEREWKREGAPDADFFTVVAWGKLAEVVTNNLSKGRLVAVSGRLENRSYQAQDGSTRTVTEVIADQIKFLDWPSNGQAQQHEVPPPAIQEQPVPVATVPDESIPW